MSDVCQTFYFAKNSKLPFLCHEIKGNILVEMSRRMLQMKQRETTVTQWHGDGASQRHSSHWIGGRSYLEIEH
jgi:hypothetical protein